MLINFENDWLPTVDENLKKIGYKYTALDTEAWKQLYDEGLSPFAAINESEFDGQITWFEFRKLQNFK